MLEIKKLKLEQIEGAAMLLAEAFVADAGMIVLFPRHKPARLRAAMYDWYVHTLKMWLANSQPVLCAIEGAELKGVLIVTDTSQQMNWVSQIGWALQIGSKHGLAPAMRAMEHDNQREKQFDVLPAFIVEFVAVSALTRGQGIGKLLFKTLHRGFDKKPGWLETTKEENLLIFAKLGYQYVRTNVAHGVDHHQMKLEQK